MAIDLTSLVAPAHTVVVTQECQRGARPPPPAPPRRAEPPPGRGVPAPARLVAAARAAGVPVVHCVAARRADGRGPNDNARLFAGMRKLPVALLPDTDAVAVIPEIGVSEADVVLTRLHGLGPMGGTDLDAVLRNLGATTVVGVGVSVNVGMANFAMDAVNAGYLFVLPRDASFSGIEAFTTKYAAKCVDAGAHDVDSGSIW